MASVSAVRRFSNPLARERRKKSRRLFCGFASYLSQSVPELPGRLLRCIHSSDCFSCPPAAGYRSSASGALTNVGTEGLYWSSSSYAAGNINAGNLNFHSGNVNPLNGNNRANGFSVRCVQHLRGAVFYLLQLRVPTFGTLRKQLPATRNGAGHGSRQCGM